MNSIIYYEEIRPMHESGKLLRTKRQGIVKQGGWTVLAFFLLIPANLFGQMTSPRTIDETTRLSASLSTYDQFKSNLDGGGDVSVSHVALGIGGAVSVNDKVGLGVRVSYDREEYNFSNANSFSVYNPWNQINRLGLGMRLGYKLNDCWSLNGSPIIQYAGENGARFGDSLIYGGVVSAACRVNPDFTIGFGAGIFYRLEEARVFPSLLISWKITDRLRLGNSFHLGPTGPAGLELSYNLDQRWELATGGGHRSSRFRLDREGFTQGGIGENSSWPVYARISRKLGSLFYLDLYGGVAFGGKMKLQDGSGHDINSVNYNATPLLGCNLRTTF